MKKFPDRKLTDVFTPASAGVTGTETTGAPARAEEAQPAGRFAENPGPGDDMLAKDGLSSGPSSPDAPANDDEAALRRDRAIPEERKLQAGFALGAFSTLRAKEIVYISEPITSGKRLFEYMDGHGYKTLAEAQQDKDAFFDAVVAPNLAEGDRVAETWEKKTRGAVIATTDFEKNIRGQQAPQWGQDDFMSMWIALVEKKVTRMVMVDGWQYSNGSGEEYLQAVLMQMGDRSRSDIAVTDEHGKTLKLDHGLQLLADAFDDVRTRGLDACNMAETLARLVEAERRYAAGEDAPAAAPRELTYDRAKAAAVGEKVREILKRDYPEIEAIVEKAPSREFSPIDDLFRPIQKNLGLKKPAP